MNSNTAISSQPYTEDKQGDTASTPPGKRNRKVYQACSCCRKQKLKCDGRQPCHRCQSSARASQCQYDDDDNGPQLHRMVNSSIFGDILSRLERLEGATDRILRLAEQSWATDHAKRPIESLRESPERNMDESHHLSDPGVHQQTAVLPQYASMVDVPPPLASPSTHSTPSTGKQSADTDTQRDPKAGRIQAPNAALAPYPPANRYSPVGQKEALAIKPRDKQPMCPISGGLLTVAQAEMLLNTYIQRIDPFLPMLDHNELTLRKLRKTSPFLLSVILATVTRFSIQYTELFEQLADLVEAHVAHTLLNTSHHLEDIQACLLLSAYGLRKNGVGLDPWVLSGHTIRLASQLGLQDCWNYDDSHPKCKTQRAKHLTMLLIFILDTCVTYGFGRPLTRWPMSMRALNTEPLLKSRYRESKDVFVSAFAILVKIPLAVMSILDYPAHGPQVDPGFREKLLHELSMAYEYLITWDEQWLMSPLGRELIPHHAYVLNLVRDHIFVTLDSLAKDLNNMHSGPDFSAVTHGLFESFRGKAISNAIGLSHHLGAETDDSFVSFAPDYTIVCNAQVALFLVRMSDALRAKPWQTDVMERRQDLWRRADILVKSLARLDKSYCQMGTYMSNRIEAIMQSQERIPALSAAPANGLKRRAISNQYFDQPMDLPSGAHHQQYGHEPITPSINDFQVPVVSHEAPGTQVDINPEFGLENPNWDSALFGQLWDPSLVPFMSLLDKSIMGLGEDLPT